MRWLMFGTYDLSRHPRAGVLMEGLRAAGDQVVELNVPLTLDTAARVAMLRQPWRLPVLAAKLARCWTLLAVRSRRYRGGTGSPDPVDAVLIGYLGHFDVRLARRLFPRTPIVLDHLVSATGTAADRGLAGSGGLKHRLMRWIDDGALRSADVVVVDTEEHLAQLPPAGADRGVVALVGAADAWFAAGAQRREQDGLAASPTRASASGGASASDGASALGGAAGGAGRRRLRAIFVGLFTPLHGTATLGSALGALAEDEGIEVTMVGTGQDYAACRQAAAGNPRVTWVDWVPAAQLPALVAEHDVCLGIFGTTDKARNVVPNKIFQGAAAGCALITSDTPPQRRTLGDAAFFVPPGDAAALASALRDLAADPDRLARLRAVAAERAAAWFAPIAVAEPVRQRLASLSPRQPVP